MMEETEGKFEFDLPSLDLCDDIVDNEDYTIFNQDDLPHGGFQVMEEIRRKGKLCDVTLKVSW